ncbi:hypothetical protein [uncultured Draconibacterium sp.]|uniref:hypothetical protein n=1 Tax=uncultured Draconibacterium sp. TaxID=1573823 RepID=UPI002AA86EDD|nr:hypothetical protein [uncultured Draconibacterium sp.]
MKKLVFLLTAVVVTAFSSSVFAQGTGGAPIVGSSHDYWVNASSESNQTSGVGNNYTWWVSTNTADLTDQEVAGTDFTVNSGTYAGVGGEDNFTIDITWNNSAVGNTYYVVVEETDAEGCKNLKAMAVQPVASDFALQFVALAANGDAGNDLDRCAPDIAISASGTTISYDYGSDTLAFKLIATDIYSAWDFTGTFDNTLGTATPTLQYQVGGTAGAWSVFTSGDAVTIPYNATGTEDVYVRVVVDNGTSEEGTSAQTVELTLSNVTGTGNVAVTEITDASDADITASPVQTQTVKARPATSGIGSN